MARLDDFLVNDTHLSTRNPTTLRLSGRLLEAVNFLNVDISLETFSIYVVKRI